MMKGDTISRSELKDDIRKWITNCYMVGDDQTPEVLRLCIDLVDAQSVVAAAPEWISVGDGLPDKAGWYLVFRTKHTHAETAFFKGKTFPLDNYYGTITHWMPLPNSPKDGGEGE